MTNKRDVTTDLVVLELRRRGADFVRLNTEDVGAGLVCYGPEEGWTYEVAGRRFRHGDVTGAYYRRPESPAEPSDVEPAVAAYCVAEWSAVLRSLWNALEGRWLNSPFAVLRAEDKPRQLSLATEVGFAVPPTLVTNDPDALAAFAGAGALIGKPLRQALIERGPTGEVIFTSRLDQPAPADAPAVRIAPVIYQREIPKTCDVRVTVVDGRPFAVAIHSQAKAETVVDWRRGSRPDLRHEVIELDARASRMCVDLTGRLGLRYAAIDLVADLEGRLWFLEINPNGQWAWIERRTGLGIAAAICDALGAAS